MRRPLALVLTFLHDLALAVWLGGLVVVGAVTAPALFRTAKAQGQTQWGDPLYTFAGQAAGEAFRRFNGIALLCGLIAVVCGVASARASGAWNRTALLRTLLTLVGTGISGYISFGLFPRMIELRDRGEMAAFNHLHVFYEGLARGTVLLLLVVLFLAAGMKSGPRRTAE